MREISLDRLRTLVAIADLGWGHAKMRPVRYHKPSSNEGGANHTFQ